MKSILRSVSVLLMTIAINAGAEVKMNPIFTGDMVLQQQAEVTMRGTAAPGSRVKVRAAWRPGTIATRADSDGNWKLQLSTPDAGGPYDIVVTDRDGSLTLPGVLIGDVWVCGGQSNMEMPLRGFPGQPVTGTLDMITRADADRPIRLFRQQHAWSTTPCADIDSATWTTVTPATAGDFSATGYIFGDYLQGVIDIPVGLIQCCWSNSRIEAWMPREAFIAGFPDTQLPETGQTQFGWLEGTPTLLYNGMVEGWKGFPIKGVIWYQGEANHPYPAEYEKLFPVWAESWRKTFANDTLPVYYVQLVPHNAGDPDGTAWADFREVQTRLRYSTPHADMITTGDIGDSIFIHAPLKLEVGRRLARLALDDTYGRKGADVKAPIARACSYNDKENSVWITFDNPGGGLIPTQRYLTGFEIVDSQGNIHNAKAKAFGGNGIAVWSPVPDPVEVRYGYHNYYEATLFNNMMIPAAPFRLKFSK